MGNLLELRNPADLIETYASIEISRASSEGGSYSVVSTPDIDTDTASDLSTGYTQYNDTAGGTTDWYKFRYKTSGGAYGPYSDEFQAGTSTIEARFRREIRDTNSADYFFSADDVANFKRDAIFSLWPLTWFEDIDETLSTDGTTEKFGFPSGVTRVNDIELIDSNGSAVASVKGWKQRSRQVIFSVAPASGYTLRLYVDKMFRKLAEVPEVYDEYILDYMKLKAYKVLQSDRMKYYKYNAVVKAEGGNLPSIALAIRDKKLELKDRLNELRRTRKPADINMG